MTTEQTDTLVEIRLATTGVVWHAAVEAQGADHLRVRLVPDEVGVLPVFAPGTSLECMLQGSDGKYYLDASVLSQREAKLWLRLPPVWLKAERRQSARTSGGFAVSYACNVGAEDGRRKGIAACINISAGGMRLRLKHPVPHSTRMEMTFTLPGESLPVRTSGVVLHTYPDDETSAGIDLGVKFVDLQPGDGARIARYCGE